MGNSTTAQSSGHHVVSEARATGAADRAEQAAKIARDAAKRASVVQEQMQEWASHQEAEEVARRSWFSSAQGGIRDRRHHVQLEAVQADADAKVAASQAESESWAAAVAAEQAKLRTAEAEKMECEAQLEQMQRRLEVAEERVRTLEQKIRRQQLAWVAALLVGLALGALLGGLAGAAAATASSSGGQLEPGSPSWSSEHVASQDAASIVSAVAGLTFQMFSLPNVLTGFGSLAVSGVYVYFIFRFWRFLIDGAELTAEAKEGEICQAAQLSAALSLGYGLVLVLAGDRMWSRGDHGSRILGGLLYSCATPAAPFVVACGLRVLGWRWLAEIRLLGSPGRQSLIDMHRAGPAPAVLLISLAGIAAAVVLYARSQFPLLLIPGMMCLFCAVMALAMMLWSQLRLPRCSSAALQPEVLTILGFGALALAGASSAAAERQMAPAIRLALLVSGMNSLLLALPAVVLGLLERSVPDRNNLAATSIYRPPQFAQECVRLALHMQESLQFAVAAGIYIVVWVAIMTSALRLHLWTYRPFVLISLTALCAVSPMGSILWTLVFRVPIGLWFMAIVMASESNDSSVADPVLQEVLRWLGPHPAPFLHLLHSLMQACTASTAMVFLGSGLAYTVKEIGQHSTVPSMVSWLLCFLAVAARADCKGPFLSLCFAAWALGFLLLGVRLLPRWSTTSTIVVVVLAARLCLCSNGSLLITLCCSGIVCFLCITLDFGEGRATNAIRRAFLHGQTERIERVPLGTRLAVSGFLFIMGVTSDEAVLVTLGCFCVYTSLASTVPLDDDFSRAVVVASCGLATMLLGELAQAYMLPVQAAIITVLQCLPVYSALFDEAAMEGLLGEVWALRSFLRDVQALVDGRA